LSIIRLQREAELSVAHKLVMNRLEQYDYTLRCAVAVIKPWQQGPLSAYSSQQEVNNDIS